MTDMIKVQPIVKTAIDNMIYTKPSTDRWLAEKRATPLLSKKRKGKNTTPPPIRIVMRFDQVLIGATFFRNLTDNIVWIKTSKNNAYYEPREATRKKGRVQAYSGYLIYNNTSYKNKSRSYCKFPPHKTVYRDKYKQTIKKTKSQYRKKKKKVIYVPIEKDYSLF